MSTSLNVRGTIRSSSDTAFEKRKSGKRRLNNIWGAFSKRGEKNQLLKLERTKSDGAITPMSIEKPISDKKPKRKSVGFIPSEYEEEREYRQTADSPVSPVSPLLVKYLTPQITDQEHSQEHSQETSIRVDSVSEEEEPIYDTLPEEWEYGSSLEATLFQSWSKKKYEIMYGVVAVLEDAVSKYEMDIYPKGYQFERVELDFGKSRLLLYPGGLDVVSVPISITIG